MTTGTMFEDNSIPSVPSFNRPSTLRQAMTANFEYGKSFWDANQNIWQSSGESLDHKTRNETLQSKAVKPASSTSDRFGRSSQGPALTPIANPSTRTTWSNSLNSNSPSHQQISMLSSKKRGEEAWFFDRASRGDLENSSLFEGSAPLMDDSYDNFSSGYDTEHHGYFQDHEAENSIYSNGPARLSQNGKQGRSQFGNGHPSEAFELQQTRTPTPGVNDLDTLQGLNQFNKPTSTRSGSQPATESYKAVSGSFPWKNARFLSQANGYADRRSAAVEDATESLGQMDLHQTNQNGFNPTEPSMLLQRGIHDFTRLNGQNYSGSFDHNKELKHLANGDVQSFQHSFRSQATFHQSPAWQNDDRRDSSMHHDSHGFNGYTGPNSEMTSTHTGSNTDRNDITVKTDTQAAQRTFQPAARKQNMDWQPRGPYTSAPRSYDFAAQTSPVRMNPLATPYQVSSYAVQNLCDNHYPQALSKEADHIHAVRSPLLEEFRMHRTTKRYELRDIFDHIVEFSGDQHGSRFIQLKLESAHSDEKDQIFKEIQPNSLQLMTDVFGNYVIQKLFEHGNQSQKKVLANQMKGHILTLSTQMYGCRVVQKALEHVLTYQQAGIVAELDGPNKQILKVIRDQNGNHVVQKAIERVPAEHIQFIIEAHKGEVVQLATHTYGCRVIQRILEHCDAPAKRIILDELHGCVLPLITDQFGNYVVQHVIQKGEPDDRRRVVSIVEQQLMVFSKHKFASNVVEKCIEYADNDQRAAIIRGLIGHDEQGQTPVLGLLRDQYGNYVIQRVYNLLRGSELEALTTEMKLCFPHLRRTSHGKQVMAIEKLLFGNCFIPQNFNGDRQPSMTSQNSAYGNGSTTSGLRQSFAASNPGHFQPMMNFGAHRIG